MDVYMIVAFAAGMILGGIGVLAIASICLAAAEADRRALRLNRRKKNVIR